MVHTHTGCRALERERVLGVAIYMYIWVYMCIYVCVYMYIYISFIYINVHVSCSYVYVCVFVYVQLLNTHSGRRARATECCLNKTMCTYISIWYTFTGRLSVSELSTLPLQSNARCRLLVLISFRCCMYIMHIHIYK